MDAPTFHGTLSDFEGSTARIDDKPIPMTAAAEKWCASRLKKGMKVAYYLTDGKISKIWEDQSAPAGARPREEIQKEQTGGACTSPPGLKTVEGQIVFIDYAAHKVTLRDRPGATHTFIWPAAMHDKMSQLKQWWFAKLTGEHEKEVDLWRLTSQDFFKRPDDWPHQGGNRGGSGGRTFVPRNEKPMLYESVFKTLGEMFDPEKDGKGKTFEENARRVWAMTEEIGDKMAAKSGVQ